jgi:hypothetical protein
VFRHEQYLAKLTELRDQLRRALSQPEPPTGEGHTALEIAEQIKTLKSTHAIEGPPKRETIPTVATAEPVTARIRRQRDVGLANSSLAEPKLPAEHFRETFVEP